MSLQQSSCKMHFVMVHSIYGLLSPIARFLSSLADREMHHNYSRTYFSRGDFKIGVTAPSREPLWICIHLFLPVVHAASFHLTAEVFGVFRCLVVDMTEDAIKNILKGALNIRRLQFFLGFLPPYLIPSYPLLLLDVTRTISPW